MQAAQWQSLGFTVSEKFLEIMTPGNKNNEKAFPLQNKSALLTASCMFAAMLHGVDRYLLMMERRDRES